MTGLRSSLRAYALLFIVGTSLLSFACGGDKGTNPGSGGSSSTPVEPARIVLQPSGPDTLNVGATQQVHATVYAANNSVLSGQSVSYASADPYIASVSSTGLITAGGGRGGTTIFASVTTSLGVSISDSIKIVVFDPGLIGIPQAITLAQPFPASLTVGQSTPVAVKVADVYGNPVAGTTVSFTVKDGKGTIAPTSATTDANGIATIIWTVDTLLINGNTITAHTGNVQSDISCAPHPGPATAITMSLPFAGLTPNNSVRVDVSGRDAYTNVLTPQSVQFIVRDTSILTTPTSSSPASASMTSLGVGQTYVVANAGGLLDSTLVAVFPDSGVLISVAPPSLDLQTNMTFSTKVQLSTGRTTPPIGSFTATVTWDPTVLTYVSDAAVSGPNASVTVNRSNVANGSLTLGVASSTSLGQSPALRTLTFKVASTKNQHGMLGITVSDISTNNFLSLLPVTQVVSFPVRTR